MRLDGPDVPTPARGRREIRKFDGRNANHVLVLKFDGEVHNWRRKGSRPEVPPMDPKNLASRPFENASPAPIAATIALEMIRPMPGTDISRAQPLS